MTKPHILLLASHEIAEYDDLRMFTDLGYEVFCPGGYQNPAEHSGLRPALPNAPYFPELAEACDRRRRENGDPGDLIDFAKYLVPQEVLDWADVVICHHFPERWLIPQLNRFHANNVRAIWRACGQSNPMLEAHMGRFRDQFEIVRYSPKERNLPNYAGEDAVIRFGKYPDDFPLWTGEMAAVANVTQHMKQRGDACGYSFWKAATDGLPTLPAGPGSKEIGGLGELTYAEMKQYLRHARCYLYTGTQPASYTLGLMEAMLTGVPVVSIGPRAFGPGWVGDVFEGHEITQLHDNDPAKLQTLLRHRLLGDDPTFATQISVEQRKRAVDLFDVAKVGKQWDEFLCG
jgi:hypothetical protein